MNTWAKVIYWVIAVAASFPLGWWALEIHGVKETSIPMRWQQRWLNFVGALIGWVALWLLLLQYGGCFMAAACPKGAAPSWWAVLDAVVAFVGMGGYLPGTIILPLQQISTVLHLAGRRLAGQKGLDGDDARGGLTVRG